MTISLSAESGERRRIAESTAFSIIGAELFAFPERHDAVVADGALSDVEGRLRAEFRSDRNDNPDLAADLVRAAAGSRHVRRPSAAALFARSRHGCNTRRPGAAGGRRQLPDAGLCSGAGRG